MSYTLPVEGQQLVDNLFDNHEDNSLSGFYPLADGLDAFAARIALVETAQSSIDIQYYLFHRQQSTLLLSAYLLKAADRGVRVRILLDDMSQAESEKDLSALALHDNIDVRLFNPLNHRNLRFLSFITDYSRVSRRMHNKSFIVDSKVFITGGRNIGNAYFSGEDHAQFVDLDILSVGPIVEKASHAFDLYWNHPLAVNVKELYVRADPQHFATIRESFAKVVSEQYGSDSPYVQRLKSSNIVKNLQKGRLNLDWAKGYLYVDDPNKLLTSSEDTSTHMAPKMLAAMGAPKQRAVIVSPYFIPREPGVALIRSWINSGVDVTVLTNSLAATDVPVVHAGYANYRQELVAMGVKLWELKPDFAQQGNKSKITDLTGSSNASLHAKTMAFDDDRIFIGSLNLDPRSFNLNTELGVVLMSCDINAMLRSWVDSDMPHFAWRVTLSEQGELMWTDSDGSIYNHEPQTSTLARFSTWLMSWLPIESVL
ncbi:phospholipase D family protein [Pseudoalteromonas sp. SSDWG2]|uniref:phospholipase D family protein n=1 Tax=Pseudoalteromonas sp. SSDWG2 TaxID=3139391 RepID=UPI003BAB245E